MGDMADVYHWAIINDIILMYVLGHAFMVISEKNLGTMIYDYNTMIILCQLHRLR